MSRREALSLYKRIMRLHQQKLPDLYRSIGDKYARQEFRAHRDVSGEQHRQFLEQWQEYAAHLELEADIFGVGRDLADADIEALSDDQKEQLQKLHTSAKSVAVQTKAQSGQNPFDDPQQK